MSLNDQTDGARPGVYVRLGSLASITNSRNVRLLVIFYDFGLAVVAMYLAVLLRLGNTIEQLGQAGLINGALLPFGAATCISLIVMRTYRTSWRHASTADLLTIFYTVSLAVLIYLPLSFITTRLYLIPRSSIVLAWMVLFLLMGGSRVAYRLFREGRLFFSRHSMLAGQVPILIVGGGSDAELLLRSLDGSSEYYPVGILDDGAQGAWLRGVPILGAVRSVEEVIASFGDSETKPRKLVVASRTLQSSVLDELVGVSNRHGLTIARVSDPKVLRPGVHEAADLQPISVEDLLGRPQIILDPAPVGGLLEGKRVLVTGAGGSIGSEIVRQVCAVGPQAVCLIDASEFNLYSIDAEMAERWPSLPRLSRVVDIRSRTSLHRCFAGFRPDIVFHAAALKHVPLVEGNPLEGIWTNVIGSRNVCDAAALSRSQAVVLISSDKAVNPTNVMGATKRCAEGYCQALALSSDAEALGTRFVSVRFGNVLGSTGSVVPLFERQIKMGGPVTVTHPDIERFFMTIREAVQLVLQASALGVSERAMIGRVFVLDMGQPVRISDLAQQMIKLAGLRPGKDIVIRYTGLREGEKLFEELFHSSESIQGTSVPRVNVASPRTQALAEFNAALDEMEHACNQACPDTALRVLRSLVPEYGPSSC